MSRGAAAGAFFLIVTAFLFISFWPSFEARRRVERNNQTVALALDYEDLYATVGGRPQYLKEILRQAKEIPVEVLALSASASPEDEKKVRAAGFAVLWQITATDYVELRKILARLKEGDGVMATGKEAPGFPMYMGLVGSAIREKKAFLPLFEFLPQAGIATLGWDVENALVKSHMLGDREALRAETKLWPNRLLRAAKERGVRFYYLRLSPSRDWEKNRSFLAQIAVMFAIDGFTIGKPQQFRKWQNIRHDVGRRRVLLAVGLATLAPLLGFWVFALGKGPIYLRFVLFCLFSTWAGVVAYVLGSGEAYVLGLAAPNGIKAQLLLPLFVGAFFLFDRRKLKKWLEQTVKVKHVFWIGVILGGGIFLYLMRSGNFPLVPVTSAERTFRDALEAFFGARPRFKEFFIGHPALLAAMYLKKQRREWRPLLLLGLIGQISIVNTFLHFHTPLETGLLRTFHGVWMGGLLAFPLIWMLERREEKSS